MVKLWDSASGMVLGSISVRHETGSVCSIAFSPDAKLVVAGCSNGLTFLVDVKTCTILSKLVGHRDSVFAVLVSNDGRILYTGGRDGVILKRIIETGAVDCELQGHRGGVSCLACSTAGVLASGGTEGSIFLWNACEGKQLGNFRAYERTVVGLAFAWKEDVLLSGGTDLEQPLRVWSVQTGAPITFDGKQPPHIASFLVSADGQYVVSVDGNNVIRRWRIRNQE
jgi:WD40 repeat protein